MGASLSDFDQWQASQTKPDTATSDFDQWQASQAPAADTADTPIYHYDPQNHGQRSQQFDPNAEPWRSVGNGDATPVAKPGLWERAKALGRGMLPQPGESVVGAVGRDVTGLVVTPFKEALDAVAAPSVGEPRRANLRAPTPSMGLQSGTYDAEHGAVTEKQRALAALGTVANVAAPALPVGEIASPLLRAGARVGVGAGVGAANSPDDPMLGAVVGGSLGAAHAGVSEAPVLHDAAARVLFPDMAEQAAQVPSLQQRTALAEADAQVANNRVTNSTEFQRRASDRSNTATQRAGAGGTTDHAAWAEANRRAGVRQVKPAAVSDFDAWLAEKPTVAPVEESPSPQPSPPSPPDEYVSARNVVRDEQLKGSTVRDKDGNLLVVHHGTSASYGEMDPAKADPKALWGPGFYHTENPAVASTPGYAGSLESGAPQVRPAYLDIRNPYRIEDEIDADEAHALVDRFAKARPDGDYDYLHEKIDEADELRNLDHGDIHRGLQKVVSDASFNPLSAVERKAAVNTGLRDIGYDGITHIGSGKVRGSGPDLGPHRVWIAFDPSQIHSAYSDFGVAREHAGEQIVTDAADGATGDLSTRHAESHTPVDGPAPSPVPAGGLASATPSVTPAAPDPALQPSLHDQAIQSAGGPAAVAAVDGNGAPEGIVYRNAGLTFPQKTGDVVRGAIDRPYPELEHQPEDLPVRDALLGAGAGRTHGTNVARYGMAHVRAGLPDVTVKDIEAHLFADNFEMQAASRAASGDDAAVTNLKAHALLARSLSSPGVEHTPEYQTYVARYRDVMEPEYTRVATASGLTADKFRAVKPGSVYLPLPADIEASAPVSAVRPATRSLGTKQSSAVRVATGGANSYVLDAQHAAEQFLPERSRVAGENELWQAVRARGRAMTGKGDNLEPGETQIAFNDKHQLTAPESEDATHYVALPERVADGVQQYVNRTREMATPPAGTVGKAFATTKKLLTKGAVAINPAVTLTHGGNIASTVNMLPGVGVADIGRTLASAVPFGNTLTGLGEMMNADLTDAANTKALLGASRYGGLRPLEADPEALGLKNAQHKALFGQNGADPRGRAIAIQRYRQANPSASDADVAQFLNKTFGAYVPANQPAGVYAGQRTGLTTFAPAGFAFTSSAVKRLGGQSGVGGIGAATRTFAKSVVAPVVGIAAANYALSGHSPLANDEGHRGDIDLGSKDDQGRERYLKSSYAFPLLNRAANTTGIRPLIEGQGATGAYAGIANEALSQVGVVPRMAASLANQQLRLSPNDATPEAVTEPQFGDGNRFMKILQRSAGGAMGAPAGIAGSTNFSADRPLMDRTLDALHLSPVGYGRAGGAPEGSALYHALDAKMKAAYLDVYHAETQADKASVIARTIQKARADGYPQDALDLIEAQLTKASEKSAEDRAQSHAAAMSKKGLGAP